MEAAVLAEVLFDPADLSPEDREEWEACGLASDPLYAAGLTASDMHSLAYMFTLVLGPVPEAIARRRKELDPEHHVGLYFNAVRRARHEEGQRGR